MAITANSARAYTGLQANAEPTSEGTTGTLSIGQGQTVTTLADVTNAIVFAVELDTGGIVEVNLATFVPTLTGAGVNQVTTATAAGTITGSGNATIIVTGDDIAGSPLTVSVAVLNADTASAWAQKVRTALGNVSAITSLYTVGGSTTAITLTRILDRYNDSTLNISLANGTCTGITAAPTSADTTSGVNPSKCQRISGTTLAGEDFEGVDLPTPTAFYGMQIQCSGSSSSNPFLVESASGGYADTLRPSELVVKAGTGTINGIASSITFTAVIGYARAIVTIFYA
jgi:hypothetical protein